jgi:hypothetical protein
MLTGNVKGAMNKEHQSKDCIVFFEEARPRMSKRENAASYFG